MMTTIGMFFFKFSSKDGMDAMIENEYGLSAIAAKLDTPMMLDSYTSAMFMDSWGRSSYARAMVELRADVELKDTLLVDVPKFVSETYTMSTIRVEYERTPPRCSSCKVFGHVLDECPKKIVSDVLKNLKSPRQDVEGVQFTTPLAERINDIERQMLDEKLVLVDDNGKPLKRLMIRLMQIVIVKWARLTMKTSYNDNDFDDCGLTDAHKKFANSFNISLRGQLRWRM
ncbi:RNA-directed DNA polymerase, eukaryota, reverse transcriptase zinc-binding domain protein [Tanacetum coccineum]